MPIRIGAALSLRHDTRTAAIDASQEAVSALAGAAVDVAVVFASGDHLEAPEALLEGVHEALLPRELVGCGASGVLAGGSEVESGTAVAVWAAALEGGAVRTFHASSLQAQKGELQPDTVVLAGVPDIGEATGVVALADPYSFDTDALLVALREHDGAVPVFGGQASARTADGGAALFHGERVVEEGVVGLVFEGVPLAPCVSQGAAPVGPELTITASEGRVIHELAGRPALVKLREVFEGLAERERELISSGLLLGIVIDSGKPEYEQGDFLVRGVVGADTERGSIALGELVRPGQVVRLHARDAHSADRDLSRGLAALGPAAPAGALCFTCTGRGRGLFGVPDHDASTLARAFVGAPTAGFFAAGEIGPVRGANFQHSFSASVAVFSR
jgi:small ligand-binding sensory domain FIST